MPALASITSGSITSKTYTARPSQAVFTTPGVTQWTVPAGVYSISAFMVSGGQGGGFGQTVDGFAFGGYGGQGGSTLWVEKIPVSPGSIVTVTVGAGGGPAVAGVSNLPGSAGGNSGVAAGDRTCLVTNSGLTSVFAGAIWSRGIGGAGGVRDVAGSPGGGGGGAGGYGTTADPNTSANGGDGGSGGTGPPPTAGGGGASGGTRGSSSFLGIRSGGSGGGVGLLGRGATAAVPVNFPAAGLGGSGGNDGVQVLQAGLYGGGGGGGGNSSDGGAGAQGAVRIVWGSTRFYPTSNVVDF